MTLGKHKCSVHNNGAGLVSKDSRGQAACGVLEAERADFQEGLADSVKCNREFQ